MKKKTNGRKPKREVGEKRKELDLHVQSVVLFYFFFGDRCQPLVVLVRIFRLIITKHNCATIILLIDRKTIQAMFLSVLSNIEESINILSYKHITLQEYINTPAINFVFSSCADASHIQIIYLDIAI
ncbi:hypothetical protein ACJX0J_025527 [Zea mays]